MKLLLLSREFKRSKFDKYQKDEFLDQWIQILTVKEFRLDFKYYAIKNNLNSYVNNIIAKAEENFLFNEEEFWAKILNKYNDCFEMFKFQTNMLH